jgi:ABC-type multidrug transport system ATPase subunit
VLVSTHLVEDVVAACTDVMLMDDGRTVFTGVPADLEAAATSGASGFSGDSAADRGYSAILAAHRSGPAR